MQSLLQAAGVETSHLRKLERFGDSGIPKSLLGSRPRSATGGGSSSRVRPPALRRSCARHAATLVALCHGGTWCRGRVPGMWAMPCDSVSRRLCCKHGLVHFKHCACFRPGCHSSGSLQADDLACRAVPFCAIAWDRQSRMLDA